MIIELGSQRLWPVDRGCLLLLGTWYHPVPRYTWGSLLDHLFVVTIIGNRAANWNLCIVFFLLVTFSSEGSITCHTCCDTELPFQGHMKWSSKHEIPERKHLKFGSDSIHPSSGSDPGKSSPPPFGLSWMRSLPIKEVNNVINDRMCCVSVPTLN
jgi:hypothetical protein